MIVEELVEYIELNKRDCKKKRDEALEGGDRWKRFNARFETYSEIIQKIKEFKND